jgi:hypothetical protein
MKNIKTSGGIDWCVNQLASAYHPEDLFAKKKYGIFYEG